LRKAVDGDALIGLAEEPGRGLRPTKAFDVDFAFFKSFESLDRPG